MIRNGNFYKLNLGEYHMVKSIKHWYYDYTKVKFIKVTPKGYNFLNEETNKCIFPKHFYQSKKSKFKEGMWFFIAEEILITDS